MQPPVGQLPALCIPASESSSPCWHALRGDLIPVTMIGAPAARTADCLATTLGMRATLHTLVSSDQYLISPSHSLIRPFSVYATVCGPAIR